MSISKSHLDAAATNLFASSIVDNIIRLWFIEFLSSFRSAVLTAAQYIVFWLYIPCNNYNCQILPPLYRSRFHCVKCTIFTALAWRHRQCLSECGMEKGELIRILSHRSRSGVRILLKFTDLQRIYTLFSQVWKKTSLRWLVFTACAIHSETGEEGFEPPLTVLETVALPLNYSPKLPTRIWYHNTDYMSNAFFKIFRKIRHMLRTGQPRPMTSGWRSRRISGIWPRSSPFLWGSGSSAGIRGRCRYGSTCAATRDFSVCWISP